MKVLIIDNTCCEGILEIGEVYKVKVKKGKRLISVNTDLQLINEETLINIDTKLPLGAYEMIYE